MLVSTSPGLTRFIHKVAVVIARQWLAFRFRFISRRYGKLVLEHIDGVPLIILPDVFNPVLLRTGKFLVQAMSEAPITTASSILDLGTGSGVGAIFAARRGAKATAIDINPEAVRCARINAILNDLESQISILHGDLFEPVKGESFDFVIFNPPFYRGRPDSSLDRAWRSESVFERFARQLRYSLAPGGEALIVLSSDGAGNDLLRMLNEQDYRIIVFKRKNMINEVLTIYKVGNP
jgi:HemK-related putative methylase